MLTLIETEINDIARLLKMNHKCTTDTYRCEYYDTYQNNYKKCNRLIQNKIKKLENLLNEYIGYKKIFLCFYEYNKVKKEDFFHTYSIKLVNNGSKEYYCTKKLLNNMVNVHQSGLDKNKYIIDW